MPLNPAWNDFAKDRPDARAQISRNEKKHILFGWMEECFCANCGKPQGMISKHWAAHVFCLCDDCVWKHGDLPLPKVPEGWLRGPDHPTTVTLDLG